MPRDSQGSAALERPSARSLALLCAGAVAAASVLYLVVPAVACWVRRAETTVSGAEAGADGGAPHG